MVDVADLQDAQGVIGARVTELAPSDWARGTPCDGWDVRTLVVHLVEGTHMTIRLLDGASVEEARAVFGRSHGDLPAELTDALGQEHAAFARPSSLTMTVHHPAAGDVPGQLLLEFRTTDYVLHTWDLARAVGGDEGLPAGLVATVWEGLQWMAPFINKTGVYGDGPSGTLDDDAPLQTRLLDLSGRRP